MVEFVFYHFFKKPGTKNTYAGQKMTILYKSPYYEVMYGNIRVTKKNNTRNNGNN